MVEELEVSEAEIKRQTLKKTQTMIRNLQKAYNARPDDMSLAEEKQMLDIMVAAQKLAENVHKVFVALDAQKSK